ncbi:AAA family ATPase [Cohnella zeiphila]|uniref:AAA family ATPase n=1 Tax=Cohnella zeiphila TaxID=2761120 RepID=A0A7X0VXG2_9BACL|nr:AAA family ATPase [Cohnella zeiphila]MBB6733570.1 AAA family ATPase [Cohnella zeiphila]
MGKMIFFVGGAGAGKTTLAKQIAARRSAAFLDMDTLLRPAAEALMRAAGLDPLDRDSADYKRLCRDLGYRITMDAALENVSLGTDVCIVGPFTREIADPDWIAGELGRGGNAIGQENVKAIRVYLADETLYRARIEQRGSGLDRWKLDHWETFRKGLAPTPIAWPLPDGNILDFDNSLPLTEQRLNEVIRWID